MATKTTKLTIRNFKNRKTKTFDVTIPPDWEIVQRHPKNGLPEEYASVLTDDSKEVPCAILNKAVALLYVFSKKNKNLSYVGDVCITTSPDETGIFRFCFGGWEDGVFLKNIKDVFSLVKQIKAGFLPAKSFAILETGVGVN